MKRQVLLAAGLLSCSAPSAPRTTSSRPGGGPSNHVESNRVAELVHAAEQTLRDETPVDYERPYAKPWSGRSRATKLFGEACAAGHHAACWKALSIAVEPERPAIAKLIETHCLNGDLLSCRALLVTPEERFATAPGSAGRSESCEDHESTACDRRALRDECSQGFPESCKALMLMVPPEPDRDPLLDRSWALARTGCTAWVMRECAHVSSHDSDPGWKLANERECAIAANCGALARELLQMGKLLEARDMFERTCQYGVNPDSACEPLMMMYRRGVLPEPRPGRTQALADGICGNAAKVASKILRKGEKLEDRVPACKYSKSR